jgi:hypothetical protein
MFESVNEPNRALAAWKNFYRSNPLWKVIFALASYLALITSFFSVAAIVYVNGTDADLPGWVQAMASWILLSGALAAVAWYITSRKYEPTAAEALEGDSRPLILYLRPFKSDRHRVLLANPWELAGVWLAAFFSGFPSLISSYFPNRPMLARAEELLVDPLKDLGPVIAIGRPGSTRKPIGASRIQVDDGDWQAVVDSLIDRARLIVKYAGTTPGFRWEIERTFSRSPFVPILIVIPFSASDRMLGQFVQIMRDAAGIQFPQPLKPYRMLFFPQRDALQMIADGVSDDQKNLAKMNPFLPALSQVLDQVSPGRSAWYRAQARSDARGGRRRKLLFAAVALAILIYRGYVLLSQ